MKHLATLSVILALSLSGALTAQAQTKGADMHKGMDTKGMDMKKDGGKGGQIALHRGTGVVKRVDTARGAVTLDHESIKSVNWPAMTMTFNVRDRTMLENVKTGQKVQFEFVQQERDYVITSIK